MDTFGGGGSDGDATSGYAGAVIGLNSSVREQGLLLRLFTGNSQYSYEAEKQYYHTDTQYEVWSGTDGHAFRVNYAAQTTSAEAMLGYQMGFSGLWVKAFAGIAYERHDIVLTGLALKEKPDALFDPDLYLIGDGDKSNASVGDHFGAKLRVEAWAPLGEFLWVSVDASVADTNSAYSGCARLGATVPHGWTMLPQLTVGPELAIYGGENYETMRTGAFAALAKSDYEFTLSAGLSTDQDGEEKVYGNFGVYRKF